MSSTTCSKIASNIGDFFVMITKKCALYWIIIFDHTCTQLQNTPMLNDYMQTHFGETIKWKKHYGFIWAFNLIRMEINI